MRHGASENRHVAHGVANFAEVKVFEAVIVELEFESVGVEPAFAREVSQVVGSAFCAAGSERASLPLRLSARLWLRWAAALPTYALV